MRAEPTLLTDAFRCLQVCNDNTKAQPKIDRTNKYRQFRLKIERRWKTECFPFRGFSSILATAIIDNYFLHTYHNNVNDLLFEPACDEMFHALMHNNVDLIANGDREQDAYVDVEPEPAAAACAACADGSDDELGGADSEEEELAAHHAVPLTQIPGYKGPSQQWCFCGVKCTFCCFQCSRKDMVMACHQLNAPVAGGRRSCILEHAKEPKKHPRTPVGTRGVENPFTPNPGGGRGKGAEGRGSGGGGRGRGSRGRRGGGAGGDAGGGTGGNSRSARKRTRRVTDPDGDVDA
jgi:uncharacterized membrane protein YgcG